MKNKLDRRAFLKLSAALSLGVATPRFLLMPANVESTDLKNILIVIFDAFSAYHIPFYGFPRNTTPNLSKLAEKAIVYHNHYANGNFTTPGTASLLTGTLPWTHRALGHNSGVTAGLSQRNIFKVFPDHYRMVYSHNEYVNTFLQQFRADIDDYTPREELFIDKPDFLEKFLSKDHDAASIARVRGLNPWEDGYSYSLYLSRINTILKERKDERLEERLAGLSKSFPRGLPLLKPNESHFILEHAIDHMSTALTEAPQPYLGYYHLLPPHDPYHTREDFYGTFHQDDYILPQKPDHLFSGKIPYDALVKKSIDYDEFILYVDSEFARLYDSMAQNGLLENTWIVLTSDHGELFERDYAGHITPTLFQPIVRVPLLIFEPGRTSRLDIYDNTSNIDLLPTLLHLTNQELPDWLEGNALPPFKTLHPDDQDIFAFESKGTDINDPIQGGTAMLVRDHYKLVYYFGYEELGESGEMIELYDIKNDPEEFENLYPTQKQVADELLDLLLAKLEAADQPYH